MIEADDLVCEFCRVKVQNSTESDAFVQCIGTRPFFSVRRHNCISKVPLHDLVRIFNGQCDNR